MGAFVANNSNAKGKEFYVNAFLVCQRINADSRGLITLEGIQDRILITGDAPQMPSAEFGTPCFIRITTKGNKPDYDVSVLCYSPDGSANTLLAQTVQVSPQPGGPSYGGALIVNTLVLPLNSPGEYWLELVIDNKAMTRLALQVEYRRVATLPQTGMKGNQS